ASRRGIRERRAEPGDDERLSAAEPPAESSDDDSPTSLPPLRIPRAEVKTIAAGGLLFALYTVTAMPSTLWGFIVGAAYGVMLAPLASDRPPTPRRLGVAVAAAAAVAVICALPLRNIADVKPEIARVIAAEEHTTHTFQAALDAFNKGRSTVDALA